MHLLPGGGLSPGHHPVCTQHLQGVLHSSLCGVSRMLGGGLGRGVNGRNKVTHGVPSLYSSPLPVLPAPSKKKFTTVSTAATVCRRTL